MKEPIRQSNKPGGITTKTPPSGVTQRVVRRFDFDPGRNLPQGGAVPCIDDEDGTVITEGGKIARPPHGD